MPSKNSVNRPKDGLNRVRKNTRVAKKRAAARAAGEYAPARSAASLTSGQPKLTAVALYTGAVTPRGTLTTHTLSKKRAQKIARNKRYIAARKGVVDATLAETMEVDEVPATKAARAALLEVLQMPMFPENPSTGGTEMGSSEW